MGAWTTDIFDDDGAEDIIAQYNILLGYGIPYDEAYQKIKEYFYKDYQDSDDEDVYWLTIALFQWQNGILMEEVKEKALQCIENKNYLGRWKESGRKVYDKRKKTLCVFKDKLLNEVNPQNKHFPKCPSYYRKKTPYKVGDLIAYQILREPMKWDSWGDFGVHMEKVNNMLWKKYVLLRVVEVTKHPVTIVYPELDYTSSARMMLYDWVGEELPSQETISKLKFRPIVVDKCNEKWRIASGIALDCNELQCEQEDYKILYLGSDNYFEDSLPRLYQENNGCPWELPAQFNVTLVQSFSIQENTNVEWHYRNEDN